MLFQQMLPHSIAHPHKYLNIQIDWKFIFCGACEKPKMGNKINNIILRYMMLDFYDLSKTNPR